MSAAGHWWTWRCVWNVSALPPTADSRHWRFKVGFVANAAMVRDIHAVETRQLKNPERWPGFIV